MAYIQANNQVHQAEDGHVIELPVILPSSWVHLLLSDYPWLLGGGHGRDLHEQLASFWALYEHVQPGHEIYKKDRSTLKHTLPLLVHGDEGRYLKKGNFMCCTIECIIGNDQDSKKKTRACACVEDPVLSRYGDTGSGQPFDGAFAERVRLAASQQVNDSGNEFLSKFLVFGMSSLLYKKRKVVLTKAFEMVSDDLTSLHEVGVVVNGERYYAGTIGCKGDLKFHHQIGNLCRSYYNAGTKINHPICSLCLAGKDGLDFENVDDDPPWKDTMFLEKPWPQGCTPSLAQIPFQQGCPEAIWRLDLFHCWKCGLGRDLTGSSVIVLAQLRYFDAACDTQFNLPIRLERAHSSFRLWCLANGKSPALHSFSKQLLNFANEASFAWFNVKGSDNTLLTAWLLFFVKLSVATHGYRYHRFETALIETLESAVLVFEILHSHPLWLKRICAQRVQHHLAVMIRGYKVLAREAKNMEIVAYSFKPKVHALAHIRQDLQKQILNGAPMVLNPMAFSCESNESVIGHVSRLSRRVSSRTCSHRVFDRVTIKVKILIRQLKSKARLKHGSRGARQKSNKGLL